MSFLAQMPTLVQGVFPGLWGRDNQGGSLYGAFDRIEMRRNTLRRGAAVDPATFSTATVFDGTSYHKTTNNAEGPFAALSTAFHVWEVEWDATVSPATVTYYDRDTPGSARTLLRTVTSGSTGLSGVVSESTFAAALNEPWRPYIDVAVQPDGVWHVGPDAAPVDSPTDLLVDSVIVCQPWRNPRARGAEARDLCEPRRRVHRR